MTYRKTIIATLAFTTVVQGIALAGGRVVSTQVTSQALEGNLLGDSATRRARVYLPESYDLSTRRYPVAYYLHGGGRDENALFSTFSGRRTLDDLIDNGLMDEMIVVALDGSNGYAGAIYVDSEIYGNHEEYIVRDLVQHIDDNFQTIPQRESRGLVGASAGGYGALRYGMLHANVFGAVYALSPGIAGFSRPGDFLHLGEDTAVFSATGLAIAGVDGPGSHLAEVQLPSDIRTSPLRSTVFTWAAAFSPNLDDPPLLVDLPFELPSLEIVPQVRERWLEHDLHTLLSEHASDLSSLMGLAIDVGSNDELLLADNEAFHQALVGHAVPHEFQVYAGGHSDRRAERIGVAMQFVSDALVTVPEPSGSVQFLLACTLAATFGRSRTRHATKGDIL